jgi:DNA-directed RNA polymerase specialized sigma24 family protein
MISCRSIPEVEWADAKQKLCFFFSRRHRRPDAEDLAQETLFWVWQRNLPIEKQEDFLRLCHGFANKILLSAIRNGIRHGHAPLKFDVAAPEPEIQGLTGAEVQVIVAEILRIGSEQLSARDLQLLGEMADADQQDPADRTAKSGKERLQQHRLRKKLMKIVGWMKGRTRNGT